MACGTAKPQHRVGFLRFEIPAAQQACIFVGLEVRQPHDHRIRVECTGNGADPFRQTLDKEVGGLGVVSRQLGDGRARLGRFHLLRIDQRHRVHPDVFADDELHAGQADPPVGQHRGVEREVGVAEVEHDLDAHVHRVRRGGAGHFERRLPS
jgi:hypothetical protein